MGIRALQVRVHPQFGALRLGFRAADRMGGSKWYGVVYNNRTTLLLRMLTYTGP